MFGFPRSGIEVLLCFFSLLFLYFDSYSTTSSERDLAFGRNHGKSLFAFGERRLVGHGVLLEIGFVSFYIFLSGLVWDGCFPLLN